MTSIYILEIAVWLIGLIGLYIYNTKSKDFFIRSLAELPFIWVFAQAIGIFINLVNIQETTDEYILDALKKLSIYVGGISLYLMLFLRCYLKKKRAKEE